jgi:hypothetical protein
VPAYLDGKQGELVANLATKAKLPFLGSVPAPIALGLTAFMQSPWTGPAVVVDLDDHALTISVLTSSPGSVPDRDEDSLPTSFSLASVNTLTLPRLGLAAWKMRVIDGVADRCIRHSRRDPRDSGASEQMLFDQLDDVFDACKQEQMVEMVVQGSQWCQNLILRPEDVRGFCAPLVSTLLEMMRTVLQTSEAEGVDRVLVSAAAWRVPGLREGLQDELSEEAGLVTLEADAAAAGAHGLASYFQAGTLPCEHVDAVMRCPLAEPAPLKVPEKKKRLFRF